MKTKKLNSEERWILYGIPFICVAGSLFHFLYAFSGRITAIGFISPVNESIFEHTKLGIIPTILWYILSYFITKKKYNTDKNKWSLGCLISIIVSICTIPLLFYFYTEAFGIESLIVDILIFFISVILGQVLSLHIYKHSSSINFLISYAFITLILIFYIIVTVNPPKVPIFMDSQTGTYGINKVSQNR